MEKIVRNTTRKSSLFKIQAERIRFEDHLERFEDCTLLQLFPECQKYKEYLKQLTSSLIEHSFETSHKSPFFRGMNYSKKEAGFTKEEVSIYYKEWLPGVKEAELIVNFGEIKYLMEKGEGQFYDASIPFEGQMRIFEGSKVQLRVVDENGKEYVIVPPSIRAVQYDEETKTHYGIYRESQVPDEQTIEEADVLAYEIDTHLTPLKNWSQIIPQVINAKFNTVILKNLFDFKNHQAKYSILNKFSLKLTSQQLNYLSELLQKLKEEKIKVMFEINFDTKNVQIENSIEKSYCNQTNAFDLGNENVIAFLLSSLSYYLKEFRVQGYKIVDIQKLLVGYNNIQALRTTDKQELLGKCKNQSMLFLRLLTMMIKRINSQNISCCSTDCELPGLHLPLDEGGFGFTFSIKSTPTIDILGINQRISNNYYNAEVIPLDLDPVLLSVLSFASKKGLVLQDPQILSQHNLNKEKQIQQLKQSNYFRSQLSYFCSDASQCTIGEFIFSFKRSTIYDFVYNFGLEQHNYVVNSGQIRIVYGNNAEVIVKEIEGENTEVTVPGQSFVVIETILHKEE